MLQSIGFCTPNNMNKKREQSNKEISRPRVNKNYGINYNLINKDWTEDRDKVQCGYTTPHMYKSHGHTNIIITGIYK